MQCTHKPLVWIRHRVRVLGTAGRRERERKRDAMTGLCCWHLQGLVRLWCDKRPSSPALKLPSTICLCLCHVLYLLSQVKKKTCICKKKKSWFVRHYILSAHQETPLTIKPPSNSGAIWTPVVFNSNLTGHMWWCCHLLCDLSTSSPPPYSRYDSERLSEEQRTSSDPLW